MNDAIREIIQKVEQAAKPAGSLPWEPDTPHAQPIFTFDATTQTWQPSSSSASSSQEQNEITTLALFSWNIDFMLPQGPARMAAALAALHNRIAALPPHIAPIVALQECVVDDLRAIAAQDWVRAGFRITDLDDAMWASGLYGTVMLVDRRVAVRGAFRVHFASSRMQRDGLFVDLVVGGGGVDGEEGEGKEKGKGRKVVRVCNTHLESLAMDPPVRPAQVAVAAKFMKDESVHGALLTGDFNAIQPFDRTLHAVNGLQDAYLALGGAEDSEAGYTWGQQAAPELRRLYGCSRMDKVYYCGGVGVSRFERFGADVEVEGEQEKAEIIRWGGFEKAWVTDHLGVYAEVDVL